MGRWVNGAGFVLGWLACVGGAARGRPWAGPAAAAVLIGLHLAASRDPARELRRLAAVGAFGAALESAAVALGLYGYAGGWGVWWLAPAWIVALWVLLAATFESSLAWLDGRPWLAAAVGAVASPLIFSAGARLGAAGYVAPPFVSLAALAVVWSAALPLAFAVSRAAGGDCC
ncbi:MAG: DUF2878 domain-containing protein [Elusimicrobia bacterium]|nr:DUF2878 domain-containing protein [Elusimicrobiota bacterium]